GNGGPLARQATEIDCCKLYVTGDGPIGTDFIKALAALRPPNGARLGAQQGANRLDFTLGHAQVLPSSRITPTACFLGRARSNQQTMAVQAISVRLVPFGKLNRDALGSINKDQLARMKIHDLVSSLEPVRSQPRDSASTSSTAKQMWFMPILCRSRMFGS